MTAASYDQLCMGKGKSWRTTGILYVFPACATRGASRRHCGHCRSSKTTMAICAPLGGRRAGFTESCARASEANRAMEKANPTRVLFIKESTPILLAYRTCVPGARNHNG